MLSLHETEFMSEDREALGRGARHKHIMNMELMKKVIKDCWKKRERTEQSTDNDNQYENKGALNSVEERTCSSQYFVIYCQGYTNIRRELHIFAYLKLSCSLHQFLKVVTREPSIHLEQTIKLQLN